VPLGREAFVGGMCGRPVLKMSLKARSRDEADPEPFCGGRGYGRVRGSAITGLRSGVSTHAQHRRLRGMRERGTGGMGMGTGPATETSWSGAALGTTCNRGQAGGAERRAGRAGVVVVVVVDGRGWWRVSRCCSDERGGESTHTCQRATQAPSGCYARAGAIADGHPIPRSVDSLLLCNNAICRGGVRVSLPTWVVVLGGEEGRGMVVVG
jgi:hypothetical protein